MRVLPRGNWLDESGEVVAPAVPQFLPQLAVAGRATRLDLARWLTSRDNPLTSRVLANRLWKLCFGQGLARSVEDLGAQGEWPTHPELLDWLALELTDHGWDVKRVLKTIVTSAAYRQSSRPTPRRSRRTRPTASTRGSRATGWTPSSCATTRSRSRGCSRRGSAGRASSRTSPAGYWAYLNFPPREWDASPGDDQYRRGLYTWWQRTFPQPSLVAFDAPSREECTGERVRSNVPQQALALLDDPSYVEAARVFAERILRDGGASLDTRLRFAYAQALQRAPNAAERRGAGRLLAARTGRVRARSRRGGEARRDRPAPGSRATCRRSSSRPGRRWRARS